MALPANYRCWYEELAARVNSRTSRDDEMDMDANGPRLYDHLELAILYLISASQLPSTDEELFVICKAQLNGNVWGDEDVQEELVVIRQDAAEMLDKVGDLRGLMVWIALNKDRPAVNVLLRQLKLVASELLDPFSEDIELIATLNRLRFSESGFRRSDRVASIISR